MITRIRFEPVNFFEVKDDVAAGALIGYLSANHTGGPPDEPLFVFNRTKNGVEVRAFMCPPPPELPVKHHEMYAENRKHEMANRSVELSAAGKAFLAAVEMFKPRFASEEDQGTRDPWTKPPRY